jgi:hypothetical protein
MELAIIIAKLTKALVDLGIEAVQAYIAGDPSKLATVQSVLDKDKQLLAEEVQELEREKTRKALEDSTP